LVLKMANSKTAAAWETWQNYVYYGQHCEILMEKVVCRMSQGMLYKGWAKWVNVTTFLRQKDYNREVQDRTLRKVILKMENARTSGALRSWILFAAQQRREQYLMQVVVRRMGKCLLWKGFGKWLSAKRFWEKEVANRKFQDTLLRRVVLRMKNAVVAGGWRGWVVFIARQKRAQFLMKQVIGRMRRVALWKGLGKWLDVVRFVGAEQARYKFQESLLRRVVLRMKNARLACGWRGWMVFSERQRLEERLMKNVVGRMGKGMLWKGLGKWIGVNRYLRHEMMHIERKTRLLRKVLSRMQQSVVSKGLMAWTQFSRHQQMQQQKMAKVISRMGLGMLWKGFAKWVDWNSLTREAECTQERTIRRVISKMRCLACSLAMDRWKKFCINFDKETQVLRRIVSKMTNLKISFAMKTWAHFSRMMAGEDKKIGEKIAREISMKRVISRILNVKLSSAFYKWIKHIEWELHIENEAKKIVLKMTKMNLSGGWMSWKSHTKFMVEQESRKNQTVSSFVKTIHFSCKNLAGAQVRLKFAIWKDLITRHNIHLGFKDILEKKDEAHGMQKRGTAMSLLEAAMGRLLRISVQCLFHRWHVESVNFRMQEHNFEYIVSDSQLLQDRFEESPELVKKVVTPGTMSIAFTTDRNLLAKVLAANDNLLCPECESASMDEFLNKNGFEYPPDWVAGHKFNKRVEEWSHVQAISFVVEILKEKMKADRIDDKANNPRDSILEYVAEYIEFKFGSKTGPKQLKTLVQALQKNVSKPKNQRDSFLYLFTRLCGVLHPELPEAAVDFLVHNLLERILAMKNTSGGNGDKRKFPYGTIEVSKAEAFFNLVCQKELRCTKMVVESMKKEFRVVSSKLKPDKTIATEDFIQFMMETWEVHEKSPKDSNPGGRRSSAAVVSGQIGSGQDTNSLFAKPARRKSMAVASSLAKGVAKESRISIGGRKATLKVGLNRTSEEGNGGVAQRSGSGNKAGTTPLAKKSSMSQRGINAKRNSVAPSN